MDRYLGGISMERRSETREHHKLRQSVSTLEDQIRGLMLEDKEEKERSLKLRDTNIAAYTQRFHELVLLCPEAVPTEKKKVEAYINGLPENNK
nr:reverse transcriptase domain-containing protein [Tanacetum cinerariifolium]